MDSTFRLLVLDRVAPWCFCRLVINNSTRRGRMLLLVHSQKHTYHDFVSIFSCVQENLLGMVGRDVPGVPPISKLTPFFCLFFSFDVCFLVEVLIVLMMMWKLAISRSVSVMRIRGKCCTRHRREVGKESFNWTN